LFRLNTQYNSNVKKLRQTGEGVKKASDQDDVTYANKREEICAKFPWFEDLDGMWRELPKHSVNLLSNSAIGVAKLVTDFEEVSAMVPAKEVPNMSPLGDTVTPQLNFVEGPDLTPSPAFTSSPLDSPVVFSSDLPIESETPPIDVKEDVKPNVGSSFSSRFLSRSTSAAPSPTSRSTRTTKNKKDPLTEFSEASRIEQEQASREADQLHQERMARIQAGSKRDDLKHQRKMLKYQIQLRQLESRATQLGGFTPPPTPSLDGLGSSTPSLDGNSPFASSLDINSLGPFSPYTTDSAQL